MARVPYVEKSALSPADQPLLTKNYTAFKSLANSPQCLRKFWGVGGYFQEGSRVSPRLRELVLLQVGCLSGCDYEWSHHVKIALAVGISEEEVRIFTSGQALNHAGFTHDVITPTAIFPRRARAARPAR